jgi:anti-sigma-K factor RskA
MTFHEQFAEDLALYALGALPSDERRTLEAHLQDCTACSQELERCRRDAATLSLSPGEVSPPPRARERLLKAVANEPKLTPTAGRRTAWWKVALAPALAALIFAALFFYTLLRNRTLQQELASLRAEFAQNQSDVARARDVLAVLTAPDAKRVTLVEAKSKPQPQGKAVYVARTGKLVFLANNLGNVPQGKAYELWLLPASGAPIPAGVFKPDSSGNATVLGQPLPAGTEAKGFAITLEPESGSSTPTPPILMVGTD